METADDYKRMYTVEKKSIPDISAITGVTRSTVRRRLLEFGVQLRTRTEGMKAVAHKIGAHLRGTKRVFTEQWKSNISTGKIKAFDSTARGYRTTPKGYIEYTRGPNKGRSEHVVLMEAHIGRRLSEDEVVHHRDENRTNNALSNLQLMTRSEHASHHASERKLTQKRNNHGQFK